MFVQLDPDDMREVFGDFDPSAHEAEAEQRWGSTAAYRESQRRTAQYRKEDWQQIKAEGADLLHRLAAAQAAGTAPDSNPAMDLAEEHRQQITRWFYDCGYDIHTGLADMYVSDARFTAVYERVAEGLAQYLRDAIMANARRATAD